MSPITARHARRAVPPLLVLAAVAALAAPAYADPSPSGGAGDSGTSTGRVTVAVAAVQNLSDMDPWPDPPAIDGI